MKQGNTVRLIQPEIKGQIKARRINPQTDELEMLVEFQDGAETTERWFDANKLEIVEQS